MKAVCELLPCSKPAKEVFPELSDCSVMTKESISELCDC